MPAILAAQQVTFSARLSERRVVQNGVFDIQFELANSDGDHFQPPSFSDFKVVGGPSRGSSTTIINGAMTRSQSWSYSLLATRPGKFTLGSASILVGNKKMTSAPVTIEVVKGNDLVQRGAPGDEQSGVIVIAEVEDKEYYPGQQIILNYKILFTQNIQSVDILSEDDYADFFVQNMADFSKQPEIVKLHGIDYTSRIIKSMALFPHQSGTYQIDPLIMNVGVNAPFPGIQGFFTMRRMQDQRAATSPIKIKVLPLPQDAPLSFRGAVGQYSMKTFPGNIAVSTDEALSVQIELEGNGDAKRWDPPTPVADTTFQIYDPKIIHEQQTEAAGMIDHRRMLEYQLLPRQPGSYTVYIPFTYFDPNSKRYITITSDTLHVQISQGKVAARPDEDEGGLMMFSLQPVHANLFKDRFWTSWPHLLLFGLLISGSCWGLMISAKKRKEENISLHERIKSQAGKNAINGLDELSTASDNVDVRLRYEKVTELYNRFLCDQFGILPPELNEQQLPVALERNKVDGESIKRIMDLFRVCLPVRYGAAPAGYSPERLVEECRKVILSLVTQEL